MSTPALTLKLDQGRVAATLRAFRARVAPIAAERAARKVAGRVGEELVRLLEGHEDTGRNHAAWASGVEQATGESVGSTAGAQAGDARGSISGRGVERVVTVENRVPYSPFVEHGSTNPDGSQKAEPGLQLERALREGRRAAKPLIAEAVEEAWRG